jgi:hypothetical protein
VSSNFPGGKRRCRSKNSDSRHDWFSLALSRKRRQRRAEQHMRQMHYHYSDMPQLNEAPAMVLNVERAKVVAQRDRRAEWHAICFVRLWHFSDTPMYHRNVRSLGMNRLS